MNKIEEVATQFVDLALKYKGAWKEKTDFTPEEMQIVFNLVLTAGFCAKEVVSGKLEGNYVDEEGRSTREKFLVNEYSTLKVIYQDDGKEGDDFAATRWLDCSLRGVIYYPGWGKEKTREEHISGLIKSIEKSIPLEPIQLTLVGDFLCEYPPATGHHTRDEDELGPHSGGVHKFCRGYMERHRATEHSDVLVCKSCCLRVYIPKHIKTYGELREVLTKSREAYLASKEKRDFIDLMHTPFTI